MGNKWANSFADAPYLIWPYEYMEAPTWVHMIINQSFFSHRWDKPRIGYCRKGVTSSGLANLV